MRHILGRAIAGLLLSSFVFGAGYALLGFGMTFLNAPDDALPPFHFGPLVTAALLAAFFAGTVLILVGRPLYLILHDHNQWYVAMIAGLILAFAMDFMLAFTFYAAGSDSGSLLARLPDMLLTSARVGVMGAIAGIAYWLIARPGRTA